MEQNRGDWELPQELEKRILIHVGQFRQEQIGWLGEQASQFIEIARPVILS